MSLSGCLLVTLVVCIDITVGHHLKERIYEQMCGGDNNENFRQELINCISQMPRQDQLIFQLCGSALSNNTSDDYSVIMESMCQDASFAAKVALCIDHISHIFHDFNEMHDHHGHHHHHHHHEDHDRDDHGDNDPHNSTGHEDHDHHHHPHHHDFGHGSYSKECFQNVYKMFNITSPQEDESQ